MYRMMYKWTRISIVRSFLSHILIGVKSNASLIANVLLDQHAHSGHIDYLIGILSLIASLTHWGRVTHICVGKLTIIGSDNGLSPERHQAIIWINAGILLIGPLGTNSSEISIEIQTFSLKKIRLKKAAKCGSLRLGLNVLIHLYSQQMFTISWLL